jgi:hypothetical protein
MCFSLAPLLSEELQVAVQRSFGVPLTVLAGHFGKGIRNHADSAHGGQIRPNAVDSGRGQGDATRTLHGAYPAALAQSLRKAGIKCYGGGRNNRSCKHVFSHLIQAFCGNRRKNSEKALWYNRWSSRGLY